jgi:O-antigen ligase
MRQPIAAVRARLATATAQQTGSLGPLLMVAGLAALTVAAVLVGNGDLWIALTPTLIAILVCVVWLTPLRVPMLTLLVLAWAFEAPGDAFASGLVKTPWRVVGYLLWGKLSAVLPSPSLVFSGIDLVALLLFGVVAYRHFRRSTIDRSVDWTDSPRPLGAFAWLSLAAVAWMAIYGMARGGSFRFVLWQSIRWLYIPIAYALMRQALRGSPDIKTVGRLVLGVGLFRAGEAIVFRLMFPDLGTMPHTTTHADSVLFATCLGILGALLLEMPSKGTLRLCILLLPVYVWAMKANGRRLVWAEVGLVALMFWLMTPWRPLKRLLARTMLIVGVPLFLYLAAGWNSEATVFAPVQKIRSMTDPDASTSTLWRDFENDNLIYTYRQSPLLGSGFGHPFIERIKLPDVTALYELEPYIPHNSVLGLWAYGGLLGFAAMWAVFPVGLFFTVRAYRWARTPQERVTALSAAGLQVSFIMQGYGDLGFGSWGPVFTLATAYALVGKICTANGGWGAASREAREAVESAPPVHS